MTRANLSLAAVAVILVIASVAMVLGRAPSSYDNADIPEVIRDGGETTRMIKKLGLPKTLTLIAHSPAYEFNGGECHAAMHAVGRAAFDLIGIKAFEQCDTSCFSGCYHGVLQELAVRSGSAGLVNEIRILCDARPTVFERYQCFHGSGHGFLLSDDYDIRAALGTCESFGTDVARDSCYEGVFMESLTGDPEAAGVLGIEEASRADPHFPCTLFAGNESVQAACYKYQPSRFLENFEMDYAAASAECLRAPAYARAECFKRLGQHAATDVADPPRSAERFCTSVPSEYFEDCIRGGLRQAIVFPGVDPDGGAVSFCRGLASSGAKRACYKDYGRYLADMFPEREVRLRICGMFEAPYDLECAQSQ
ncbi:MAG: hypothetical protein AAB923_00830 [Patescibacteria group bacterium]